MKAAAYADKEGDHHRRRVRAAPVTTTCSSTGQAYDEGGCEIPDGYVEPNLRARPRVARDLRAAGAAASKSIGASGKEMIEISGGLSGPEGAVAVVKDELAGGRSSAEEFRAGLAMTSEIVLPSSDGPATTTAGTVSLVRTTFAQRARVRGGLVHLVERERGGVRRAREPRFGLFVVDVNGEPRVMVGPVARAFENVGSLDERLADRDAGKIVALREPWAASYTARGAVPPALDRGSTRTTIAQSFVLRSTHDIGPITVELLDHHRTPVAKGTVTVGVEEDS